MTGTGASNRVSESFWAHDYLGSVELPSRIDPEMDFERCLAQALERDAPVQRGASVVEIGCAPAKWLVFYAERFGAHVTGIEYTERGVALSRANLSSAGLEGHVEHGDFFAVEAREHDLVLSLGFIEHFDDLEGAFARHVEFLAPGATLVIGVPNYRGLLGALQRYADPDHLALHNVAAMHAGLYRRLAPLHGLEVRAQRYIGGLDPIIIRTRRPSARLLRDPLIVLRKARLMDRINHPKLSSYLLTVLRRPAP